jgi:uncharacterized membrane protein
MMLDILRILIGLPLALFIPGYLIAILFFRELSQLEKIALGFVLSICIDIAVGLLLGYNKTMKDLTGGITSLNLWAYLGSITFILLVVLFYQRAWHHKTVHHNREN